MSKNKVIKSVSFNSNSEKDREFLQHIEKVNFSGYVKDLIQADLQRRKDDRKIVHKSCNGGIKIFIGG